MTNSRNPTDAFTVWDVPALYAASFGFFAPGALMAARTYARQHPAAPTSTPASPR